MTELSAETDKTVPALSAINTNTTPQAGVGVLGKSAAAGVVGESTTWMGVFGLSHSTTGGHGVLGRADAGGAGTAGESSSTGPGVIGVNSDTTPQAGAGVVGKSAAAGVVGESTTWMGVFGLSHSTTGGHGVMGRADGGGAGAVGESTKGIGVFGSTDSGEAAVKGVHKGGGLAGFFDGDVFVSRDIKVKGDVQLTGADVAEDFGVIGDLAAEPGCVVVLAGDDQIRVSDQPYDRRVAGVVSGAGSYRPALVLDRREDATRRPLALTGKVWCKVDADCGPVQIGDMLTTSPTAGHAMCASDPTRAFGAVIGKALGTLQCGRGLLPVLVALQ
jgi:hypothetical protein